MAGKLCTLFALLALTVPLSPATGRIVLQQKPEFNSLLQLVVSNADIPSLKSGTCGPQLSIETPNCQVVAKRSVYELRSYPAGQIWVATVVANASYFLASFVGFYRCFNYISGQNSKNEKIEMTAPVHIQPDPESNGYKIAFFAPSRFKSISDLPRPLDPNVMFLVTEAHMHAVLGPFGGFPGESEYLQKWKELEEALQKDKVAFNESTVLYAGYSSPFQIIDRKQEVHVQVI